MKQIIILENGQPPIIEGFTIGETLDMLNKATNFVLSLPVNFPRPEAEPLPQDEPKKDGE